MNLPELVSGHGCLEELSSEVQKDFIYLYRTKAGSNLSLNDLDTMDQALFDTGWKDIVSEIMRGGSVVDSMGVDDNKEEILNPDVVV